MFKPSTSPTVRAMASDQIRAAIRRLDGLTMDQELLIEARYRGLNGCTDSRGFVWRPQGV